MKLLIILLLASCSSIPPKFHPQFKRHVENFFTLYRKPIPSDLDIVMDCEIESKKAGGYYHRIENRTHINCNSWYGNSWDFQEMVMFHELGHHVLSRRHESYEAFADKCPKSMMVWNIGEYCYTKHRNHYLKELFQKEDTMWRRND